MSLPVVRILPSHPSQGAFVEINESDFDASKHEIYVAPADVAAPPPPPPPPPPAPVDPLANLPEDWRTLDNVRALAATVGGRAVENTEQAVAVIEQALAARA